ncbi:ABC transporter ATP-binding protein [Clostridium estertheticum]|uniref:ABC transporter ATP-binding protein n=1 Tax=Clostridium estertheticum TaxID=238834 RepID=A0AA47EFA7_9CLOT|nr:ABC transporter ATP-binding protein [Clostridium estertheticum]MBU3155951.1 ABC transporter ATP-binding protein [Clostridium estertheticum]MBU3200564.1 ABC transporter ATP-binding protein [Clostridium estertheticum]WAG59144.1 ABC transporter ATP-binding protein [Clostridium estertheticum]WAG66803.1 ABC transporter ATP-binding protein [Clostridium estertheticum]
MLLEVKNLKTQFRVKGGLVNAVDGVDFEVDKGEILAIVGESGSGKSVTSLSILSLIPNPPGEIIGGEILFKGEDLLKKSNKEMRNIRGNEIAMIFQEPMTSLNPVFTVGKQIAETITRHKKLKKKDAMAEAVKMLELVGIPTPEKRINDYPHQLSGGMRQRVMIAIALSCNPELLIADEPTTALDVTIQAQILELIVKLKDKFGTAILLITHDLGVVAETADKVVVMYCGKIVESATSLQLFEKPLHPYTEGLLLSIPKVDEKVDQLFMIPGMVPNPLHMPKGCSFSDRCNKCMDICKVKQPELVEYEGRKVRCFLYSDKREGQV